MIKFTSINKSFFTKSGKLDVLKDINLDVKKSEIFGIIGKSGAGKSTLLRLVNLLEKPTSGELEVDGEVLSRLSNDKLLKRRRNIGMIFQHFNLLSSRTAYGNIALPLELAKVQDKEKKIDVLLELTGLKDKRDAYPSQLSGGQKQRVAIARALALNPHLLLCDEATSALDPLTTRTILDLLKDINEKLGLTILIITHEMHVIKDICDRVGVLEDGVLVEVAKVVDLFTSPKSETAKQLTRATLRAKLPNEIESLLHIEHGKGKYPVWSVSFFGEATKEPLIAKLIETFHLKINILQANIELIAHETFGTMTVEVFGQEEMIQKGKAYFEEKGVQIETIGYIEKND